LKNFFEKYLFSLFKIFLVILSFLAIYQSDVLQKKIFPQKYWEKQVNFYNSSMQLCDWKIHSIELAIEKEKTVLPCALKKAALHAQITPQTVKECVESQKKKTQEKLKKYVDEIKSLKKEKQHLKLKVKISKEELQKVMPNEN